MNYLYTHKGVVYFLLDAQNIVEGVGKDSLPGRYMYDKFTFEGMKEGDIYSYTPATGQVELIYPAQALRLKVADDGIYYLKGQLDKTEKKATGLKWYYIPFGGTEPEQIESGGMDDVWNDYQYDRSENTLRLKSETTGDVIEIVPDNEYMHSCVYKDMIFSSKTKPATVLKCFDLLTQEEKYTYNLEESITSTDWAPKEGTGALRKFQSDGLLSLVEHGNIQSTRFAMTEDSMLWFLVQQYIYRINTETGETQLFYYPVKGNYADGSFATMSPLYTDGKNLYVIYYPDDKVAEPVFGRLVFGYEETSGIWHWDVTDKIGVND